MSDKEKWERELKWLVWKTTLSAQEIADTYMLRCRMLGAQEYYKTN